MYLFWKTYLICRFRHEQMSTPRKTAATIAVGSRLGLRNHPV